MDSIKKIIQPKIKNKNIHSEIHYWADVISTAFGERKKFAMYLGVIKRLGVKEAQRIFSEIKDSKVSSPGKLFVWKAKRNNTPLDKGGRGGILANNPLNPPLLRGK